MSCLPGWVKVEVVGIEPTSEDKALKTSPYSVYLWFLAFSERTDTLSKSQPKCPRVVSGFVGSPWTQKPD